MCLCPRVPMPARRERRFIADPESMKRVVALLLAPVVFQLALVLVAAFRSSTLAGVQATRTERQVGRSHHAAGAPACIRSEVSAHLRPDARRDLPAWPPPHARCDSSWGVPGSAPTSRAGPRASSSRRDSRVTGDRGRVVDFSRCPATINEAAARWPCY